MSDKPSLLPPWAISHQDALDLIPPSGFLHDYMTYRQECTDAPLIYHYGVAATILSTAISDADILCKDASGAGRHYVIPTPMWSALIGISGAARKSSSMDTGVHLLTRAKSQSTDPEILLPSDGSLEGWHDFMVEHNQVLLHRDELAVLFDQARRGYSDGMKHWLMEMYSGRPKARSTVKGAKAKEEKMIERPRIGILGGIPPDTFSQKAKSVDWRSGFLARIVFWPGDREWFNRTPGSCGATETALARWLADIACKVNGFIEIPKDCHSTLIDWFYTEVECKRRSFAPEFYSHLVRYQDLGLRLAAVHAVARGTPYHSIAVTMEDMKYVISALNLLKRATQHLFVSTQKDNERNGEDEIVEFLQKKNRPIRLSEMQKGFSISTATLSRRLNVLVAAETIKKKKAPSLGKGRPAWLYFLNVT